MSTEASPSLAAPVKSTPWWLTLYNHNPFYVISTVLMLISVRAAYGEMPIGEINCWVVMGVLAGYTTLLALIGICIIRFGKIWEDARSILLLLLLLFLGISVSMDDLFVKLETPAEGALLAATGVGFSFLITEGVLFLTGIRLRIRYRIPYYLFLMLFFFTPWWMSPELNPRSSAETEWLLLLFPIAAAGNLLALLPAVWGGPKYVRNNGTPWKWPLFPWSMFFMLIVATMIRSYALCLTFGPTGPIWHKLSSGGVGIVFSTIWGTWFLVPILWAILLLLLEGGIVAHCSKQRKWSLALAPALIFLAFPFGNSTVFTDFWDCMLTTVGSPIWIATILVILFYGWATLRHVSRAIYGFLGSFLLLAWIGPHTEQWPALIPQQAWPIALVGFGLLIKGLMERSSLYQTAASALLISSAAVLIQQSSYTQWTTEVTFVLTWLTALILGSCHRDDLGCFLRFVASTQAILVGYQILTRTLPLELNIGYRLLILVALTGLCLLLAIGLKNRWYLFAFTGNFLLLLYGAVVIGYQQASSQFGATAMLTFSWSLGMLLFAMLISAHKAEWLPRRLIPKNWTA